MSTKKTSHAFTCGASTITINNGKLHAEEPSIVKLFRALFGSKPEKQQTHTADMFEDFVTA